MSDYEPRIYEPANLTLDEIRAKLAAFHFAKEALLKGEREILLLAETLLKALDDAYDGSCGCLG
jgi:hypothetical protein